MKRGKWQIPLQDGDEQDYLTRYHHRLLPGRSKRMRRRHVKTKWNRRIRHHEKQQALQQALIAWRMKD